MKTLKNDILSIKVDRHGAELCSIRDHSGREFIWQADPAFWKRHAPVLFPIVGSLWEKKYRIDGKEYTLGQHGFAGAGCARQKHVVPACGCNDHGAPRQRLSHHVRKIRGGIPAGSGVKGDGGGRGKGHKAPQRIHDLPGCAGGIDLHRVAARLGGFGGGFGGDGVDLGDIFGDIFGDLFGGGGRSRRANNGPMKGANLRARVNITFEEAVFGCEKELEIVLKDECTTCHGTGAKPGTSPVTCPKCHGEGQIVYTQQSMFGTVQNVQTCPDCHGTGKIIRDKCPDCHGTGYVSNRKTIEVTVPAGIDNGQSIRIRGKGEPGTNGGPRGDLLVEVIVERHPKFQRQDTTIYSTEPISFTQAALGGKIQIPTVDGPYEYTIKPGTQTDTRIRLKGKGVPMVRNKNVRGDHYVTLVVQVPEHLNGEQRAALQKFQEAMGEVPKKEEAHKEHKGFFGKHKK